MDLSLILSLAVAGLALGVVEGVKPGPLLTMVIKETLSGGFRAGMWTAAAPHIYRWATRDSKPTSR